MKRILYSIFFLLLMACSKSAITPELESHIAENNKIQTLIQKAELLYADKCNNTKSSGVHVDKNHIYFLTTTPTRSNDKDTSVVVLNFENQKGFVILPYEPEFAEFIAVTYSGFYDGSPTEIDAFNSYMQEILTCIANYKKQPNSDFENNTIATKTTTSHTVKPIIPVSWNQDAPFNWYYSFPYNPKIPAGCVAIAIAQSMTVAKHPSTINLTYPNASLTSTTMDWEKMLTHNSICNRNCSICQMKAHLLREIGNRTKTTYEENNSSAYALKYAKSCLSSFGYNCSDYSDFNITLIEKSLDAGNPTIIIGYTHDNKEGHAWNIDGYEYNKSVRYQQDIETNLTIGTSTTETWYTDFKFGWGGSKDGHYLSYQKITGTGSFSYNGKDAVYVPVSIFSNDFNNNVKIFTDIKPF